MWALGFIVLLFVLAFGLFWGVTYHPASIQSEPVACSDQAPVLQPGQLVKVMTWNVQFMAGKNYVFWNDVPGDAGRDDRPSPQDITAALQEVARIIRDENPDIILLQEVDHGAARTDYEDQLARLRALLPPDYACAASAFYWKAAYVPREHINGAVGLEIAIVSKYRISSALRHQLPVPPNDLLHREFGPKRAALEVHLPVAQSADFVVFNTHLDAAAQGTDTLARQTAHLDQLVGQLDTTGQPWILGGDFNMLPPDDAAYQRLTAGHQSFYNLQSEIAPLYAQYQVVPSLAEATGPDYAQWFTYFPNDPAIARLDRTLDYVFLGKSLRLSDHYVRQRDTQAASDHAPLIVTFQIP